MTEVGSPVAADHDPERREEMRMALRNGRVGSELISESDRVRVWQITLEPGARLPYHTHVLDYFWTATTHGHARSTYADGKVVEMNYEPHMTKHFHYEKGDSMTHDLENIGESTLCFITVEFLDSANSPISVA